MKRSPRAPKNTSSPARARPAPPDPARDRALDVLLEYSRAFPERLPEAIELADISGRDAAFAHAIVDAALRRRLTLAAVLQIRLRDPFDTLRPDAQAALLGGAAQILLLTKVPPHAAINHSVEWVKRRAGAGIGGMVNAVLRGLTRMILWDPPAEDAPPRPSRRPAWNDERDAIPLSDGGALVFKGPVLPEEPAARLAAAASCPLILVERWTAAFGADAARALALHLLADPPTVINAVHARWREAPAHMAAHSAPGHYVWTRPRDALVEFLGEHPEVWVQDSASSHPVAALASLAGEVGDGLIVDLCAGRGTKTRQLAAVFPRARIIATETDAARLAALREAVALLPRVEVVASEEVEAKVGADAALVLLDVPCSNSGVLPRRLEARYRWSTEQLDRLVAIQRSIFARGRALVRSGGVVAYSTCSIDREENQDQAAWAATLGLTLEREHTVAPAGTTGQPGTAYSDASYVAVMRVGR